MGRRLVVLVVLGLAAAPMQQRGALVNGMAVYTQHKETCTWPWVCVLGYEVRGAGGRRTACNSRLGMHGAAASRAHLNLTGIKLCLKAPFTDRPRDCGRCWLDGDGSPASHTLGRRVTSPSLFLLAS
ncbi:hypothetical protein E2C01_073934 [Portunus trituberculatus]|uniref:Uncharacterized protein n=1 Tax=Portunus trituberculatus TaxID=210409 RepID=A0A5B7IEZ9_PORTR|nr:hypothetical protein [Portunus trituberculatus]